MTTTISPAEIRCLYFNRHYTIRHIATYIANKGYMVDEEYIRRIVRRKTLETSNTNTPVIPQPA